LVHPDPSIGAALLDVSDHCTTRIRSGLKILDGLLVNLEKKKNYGMV
jgi:hypothetical protein